MTARPRLRRGATWLMDIRKVTGTLRYRTGSLSAGVSCLLCLALILGPDPLATSAFDTWVLSADFGRYVPTDDWLTAYLIANVISVRFVRRHSAARWVLAGLIISHIWAIVLAATSAHDAVIFSGLCFCWAAVSLAVYRHRDEFRFPSAYGIWIIATLLLYITAIKFEVQDVFVWSAAYPYYELG